MDETPRKKQSKRKKQEISDYRIVVEYDENYGVTLDDIMRSKEFKDIVWKLLFSK